MHVCDSVLGALLFTSVHMCVCVLILLEPEEGIRPSGAEITGVWVQPDMSAWN